MTSHKLFKSILNEECPSCGKGCVFQKSGPFTLPTMHEKCELCNYHFDRESGYFIGAMYISYGLSVAQGIITFLLLYFFTDLKNPMWFILAIFTVLGLISIKNYKLSRVIYMHIFPW